jgi:hypothetical protein
VRPVGPRDLPDPDPAYWIKGIARLASADAKRIRTDLDWRPEPSGCRAELPSELGSRVPQAGGWLATAKDIEIGPQISGRLHLLPEELLVSRSRSSPVHE